MRRPGIGVPGIFSFCPGNFASLSSKLMFGPNLSMATLEVVRGSTSKREGLFFRIGIWTCCPQQVSAHHLDEEFDCFIEIRDNHTDMIDIVRAGDSDPVFRSRKEAFAVDLRRDLSAARVSLPEEDTAGA